VFDKKFGKCEKTNGTVENVHFWENKDTYVDTPILFGALPLMSYIGMYGPEG